MPKVLNTHKAVLRENFIVLSKEIRRISYQQINSAHESSRKKEAHQRGREGRK
jgi:predicted translin family RNA/ssDNA-binding protein